MSNKRIQIWIVGTGVGSRRLLTRQASAALKMAGLVISTKRISAEIMELLDADAELVISCDPDDIKRRVEEADVNTAVLVPGDPGHSADGNEVIRVLMDLRPLIIPGIPEMTYMAARTGISAKEAVCADLSLKDTNMEAYLRADAPVFLSASDNNLPYLQNLAKRGYEMAVYAGEHLGRDEERISSGTLSDMAGRVYATDAVFFLLKAGGCEAGNAGETPEDGKNTLLPRSLPADIRASVLARMAVRPEDRVYVIGSAGGDLAAEASVLASRGSVYAFEKRERAAGALRVRAEELKLGNLKVCAGRAPASMAHLPAPDTAVINGCFQEQKDLIQILLSRNPLVRLTVVSRSLEGALSALRSMELYHMSPAISQISVTEFSGTGGYHLVKPSQTLYLITGRKSEEKGEVG